MEKKRKKIAVVEKIRKVIKRFVWDERMQHLSILQYGLIERHKLSDFSFQNENNLNQ